MSANIGPLLTDARFFGELLNHSFPGLEAIASAAAAGDYGECRKIFAAFLRGYLQPEVYRPTHPIRTPLDVLVFTGTAGASADDAAENKMSSCGFPWDFGEGPIDWFSNHALYEYEEWTWQLSRHAEWRNMAKAYRETGDEKYAVATARQLRSWLFQATAPEPCSGGDTLRWRTIECGIRMATVWPDVIHTFIASPAFTDDLLTDFCKSVVEHGERLRRDHRTGNWLIMEMCGLTAIGTLYPFLNDAQGWYDYATVKLEHELTVQVYPDGLQYELSTNYQYVVIGNYLNMVQLTRAYGQELSKKIVDTVENMLLAYVKLMLPDGKVPDINDGCALSVKELLSSVAAVYPENEVFRWVLTGGDEGALPEKKNVFDHSGLAALRTGWGKDDTWLFFDGGEFGVGHQHEDKLQVLFHADGDYTLTECDRYSYDTSDTRKYCLSTRGHNTVRVDGMDQNRRATYRWNGEIDKLSDLQRHFTPAVDALRAVYSDGYGYGKEQDKSITHERSVYFVKQLDNFKPFAIVVDRLTADKEHDYEVLWHLDAPKVSMNGLQVRANTLNLITPEVPMETAGLSVARGQQFPEWQGWKCNSFVQKDIRPIYTAQHWLHGQDLRWVTVLYPDGGEAAAVTGVSASLDVADTKITLQMADGSEVVLDEKEFWK